MDTLQNSLKGYGSVYSFAAIVGAIIAGYVLVMFGVPVFFPYTTYNYSIGDPLKVKKLSIPLTIGSCNFSGMAKEINTSNPYRSDFLYMPDSNNQKHGAEFSYTFWLKMTSSTLRNSGKIIFHRGIYNNRYDNEVSKGRVEGHPDNVESDKAYDLLVKCPLVRFGSSDAGETSMTLEVMFNTMKNPHNTIRLESKVFDSIRSTLNNPKWTLVTMTFRDYARDVKEGRRTNGVEVQVFLNDSLVKVHVVEDDAIKLNRGDINITPNRTGKEDSNSYFSNLTYYNYALGINDVTDVYNARANTGGCNYPLLRDQSMMGLALKNQYYRLSLHQQLRQI